MRTFPITDKSGLMIALEVENVYVGTGALAKILERVDGIGSVRRRKAFSLSHDVHVKFLYRGTPFVVVEPFGDNSRYWIGPEDSAAAKIDVGSIDQALREYEPPALVGFIGDLLSFRVPTLFRGSRAV